MKIRLREQGSVTILDLKGRLVLGEDEAAFREAIDRLVNDRSLAILINFAGVEFLDSSGVGALVKSLTTVTRAGGRLKGLKPTPVVQKILKIVGVYQLFEFFEDESTAVASF